MDNNTSYRKEIHELREKLDRYKQITTEQAKQLSRHIKDKKALEQTLRACHTEIQVLKSENENLRYQLQLSKGLKGDSKQSISFSVEHSKSSNEAETRTVHKVHEYKADKKPKKINIHESEYINMQDMKHHTDKKGVAINEGEKQPGLRRSGSMVTKMQDGKRIQAIEYKDYIETFANKDKADKIKHLVELCTPLERKTLGKPNFISIDPKKKNDKFFGLDVENIAEIQKFVDKKKINEPINEISMSLESSRPDPLETLISECFIIGCDKKHLAKYLSDRRIDFSFVYNKSITGDEQPCKDIVSFFSPFTQQIRTRRILNTIGKLNQLLFQDDIKGKQSEFFCISLNSNIKNDGFLDIPDMLKESNPSLFYYYYCVRVDDFFIREDDMGEFTSDVIDFHFHPKYYVLKTLYPLSQMFQEVLHSVLATLRRKRIEKFMNSIVGGKVDVQALILIDSEHIKSIEADIMEKIAIQLLSIKGYDKFNQELLIQSPLLTLKYTTPIKKNASFVDAQFGLFQVLNMITYEDFLFIYFSIIQELHVVFVSESPGLTTAALTTFLALMRPFRWPLPIIFNLPEDLLPMLGSPVPVLVGLNRSSQYVISHVIPKTENDDIIYVFLDHGLVYSRPEKLNEILLPQYDDFMLQCKTAYRKTFNAKSSLHIKIGYTTKNKHTVYFLKRNNYDTLQEKIFKIGKDNGVKKLEETGEGLRFGAKKTLEPDDYKLFHFFKHFYHSFIVSKLPLDGQLLESDGGTIVKNIDVEFFSSNPGDLEFLYSFINKQSFVYFLENDLYSFNTKNVSRFISFL